MQKQRKKEREREIILSIIYAVIIKSIAIVRIENRYWIGKKVSKNMH